MRRIYCVATQIPILNVSKIRLRLIFSRASDLHRLFQKAYGKKTVQNRHGRRWFCAVTRLHCKRVGKQCTRTYIVYRACGCFLCAPSICIVYFKRLTENVFSKAVEVCASTSCCTKINARRIRTATDGSGSMQKRVRLRTRSLRMYTDVHS